MLGEAGAAKVARAAKAGLHQLAGETACMPLHKVTPIALKALPYPAITMCSIMEILTLVRTVPILGIGGIAIQAAALLSAMVLEHSTSLAATDTLEAASGHKLAAVRGAITSGMASRESHM